MHTKHRLPENAQLGISSLVQFDAQLGILSLVQFDLKLSQNTTTFRCLHLHFGMEAFWPQVAEGPKEPGQFIPVWVGHFENRNDSQDLAMVARTVKSLNRHFVAPSKLALPWAEVWTALTLGAI